MKRASARSSSSSSTRRRNVANVEQRLAQGLGIVVGDTDHDVADRGLLDRIDDTGCTEVDQPEPAVGQHHDVAGMRVGVVAAVDEHLLQHRAQERVGELDGGRAHGEEVARVAHAAAVEPFHHEDARGREVVEHARDTHGRVLGQVRADLRRVAGLDAVIELLLQAVAELLGEVDDPVVGTPGRAGLDRVRELRQRVEVAQHRLRDIRPLHLDDDRLAARELRPIGLPDGRGGDGLPVELGEHVLDGRLELLLEHRRDLLARDAGFTWSWRCDSSRATSSETRSARVDSTWPSLTNMPPASSSALRSRRGMGARRSAPSASTLERPIPIAGVRPWRAAIRVICA